MTRGLAETSLSDTGKSIGMAYPKEPKGVVESMDFGFVKKNP